jgi:ribosome biogenesis GTPase
LNSQDVAGLKELGWDDGFARALAGIGDLTLEPARIATDFGTRFLIESSSGSADASLAASLQHAGRPVAVGDWVAVERRADVTLIRHVLPRRTAVGRKGPDAEVERQVIAANVDLVLIATALGPDFNLRRIERLLTVAYQSGAVPAILLTKADLDEASPYEARLAEIAPGVPALAVSALRGDGLDGVRALFGVGKTAVLLGSSGVGKSTLINRLVGDDRLRTQAVHHTGQGRHTTSHRELLRVPGGGLIIDTPGLREIQLWAGEDALGQVFADIEELARGCRFTDCRHQGEPACAVRAALDDGRLDGDRLKNYRKMQRELRAIEVRADARLQSEERRKWKATHRAVKEQTKIKRRWS